MGRIAIGGAPPPYYSNDEDVMVEAEWNITELPQGGLCHDCRWYDGPQQRTCSAFSDKLIVDPDRIGACRRYHSVEG